MSDDAEVGAATEARGVRSVYADDDKLVQQKEERAAREEAETVAAGDGSSEPLWKTLRTGSECLASLDGRWQRVQVVGTINAGYEIARFKVAAAGNDVLSGGAHATAREVGVGQLRALPKNDEARLARGRCAFFDRGECKRGDKCAFAHVLEPTRQLPGGSPSALVGDGKAPTSTGGDGSREAQLASKFLASMGVPPPPPLPHAPPPPPPPPPRQ